MSSAAQLPVPDILAASRNITRSSAVRKAAASALVWAARCPASNGFMRSATQHELEPLMFKLLSLTKGCGIAGPWALPTTRGAAYTARTGIYLGDGD